jgi:uncharacterized membrane protein YwzB
MSFILLHLISSSFGVKKIILYWYVVGDEILSSYQDVKIAQLIQKLEVTQATTAVIAVAIDLDPK